MAFKPATTEQQLHAVRALMRFQADATQQRAQVIRGVVVAEELDVCGNDITPAVYNDGLLSPNDTFLAIGRHQVSTAMWKTLAPAALDEAIAYDLAIMRKATGLPPDTRTTRTKRRG